MWYPGVAGKVCARVADRGSHGVQVDPLSLKRIRRTPDPPASSHVRERVTSGDVVADRLLLMTMVPVGGVVSRRM